jgi:opacity protein-like surface antigen
MKKQRIAVAALLAGAVSVPALAAGGPSYIDGYYVSGGVEFEVEDLGTFDDDGDGFGAKGELAFAKTAFITGEYQSLKYDDSDLDLDQLRLGLALGPGAGNGNGIYGGVEYVNIDLGETEDDDGEQSGIAGHLGLAGYITPLLRLYGQGGYVKLDDVDGPELLVGGAFDLSPNFALFADYRFTQLEDDQNDQVEFDDFRVGARFSF